MEVLINSAAMNDKLWNVKHLIELRPITFPNGEPSEGDIYNTTVGSRRKIEHFEETRKHIKLSDSPRRPLRSDAR